MAPVRLGKKYITTSSFARAFILIAAVSAIVAGVVAMHTLATSAGHADPTQTAIALEGNPNPMLEGTAATEKCAGLCAPGHGAAVMGCILVLLTGILIVGTARRGPLLLLAAQIDARRTAASRRPFPRSLPPPDLHILSISRT